MRNSAESAEWSVELRTEVIESESWLPCARFAPSVCGALLGSPVYLRQDVCAASPHKHSVFDALHQTQAASLALRKAAFNSEREKRDPRRGKLAEKNGLSANSPLKLMLRRKAHSRPCLRLSSAKNPWPIAIPKAEAAAPIKTKLRVCRLICPNGEFSLIPLPA